MPGQGPQTKPTLTPQHRKKLVFARLCTSSARRNNLVTLQSSIRFHSDHQYRNSVISNNSMQSPASRQMKTKRASLKRGMLGSYRVRNALISIEPMAAALWGRRRLHRKREKKRPVTMVCMKHEMARIQRQPRGGEARKAPMASYPAS